jgi:hypothetical protein
MPNGLPYVVQLDVILQRGSAEAVCSLRMNRQCISFAPFQVTRSG